MKNKKNIPFLIISIIFFFLIIAMITSKIMVEILWFKEVDFFSVFFTRFNTEIFLILFTFILSFLFLFINLNLADNHSFYQQNKFNSNFNNLAYKFETHSAPLPLQYLLPIVFFFFVIISLGLIFYTNTAYQLRQLNSELPNLKAPLSSSFKFNIFIEVIQTISNNIWMLFFVLLLVLLLFWKTNFFLKAIAIYQSLILGLIIGGNWSKVLTYFNSISFGKKDALFNQDLSFYIFKLPFFQLIEFWLQSIFLYAVISVTLTYLLANNSLSQGKFIGFSCYQLRHISAVSGLLMLAISGIHWLLRYLLLFSKKGVVYGAGYTDINISLHRENLATVITLAIAIWLLYKAIIGWDKKNISQLKKIEKTWLPFSAIPFIIYLTVYLGGIVIAEIFQNTIVQPNELALEEKYIIRNIEETRKAFNLDKIEVQTFNPEANLTQEILERNHLTIDNIRLWDSKPILQANRQLQQIRPYYVFPEADVDRYNIKVSEDKTEKQQVLIAARELDYNLVPKQAQTWVNQHLVYTHGYGFTMSPVNRVAEGGLPYYYIKDIGTDNDPGALNVSSPLIKQSIPISYPRIYYGKATNNYIMTNTKVQEFDFPSGDQNIYHTYDGTGGIKIDKVWRKVAFSIYLRDWRMLLTRNFTPETNLMFRRNIRERVKRIAPFLYYDRDPYLVVKTGNQITNNNLYWLLDAYTISDYYPYSDAGDNQFNYIRNSVKVLISAENGTVEFYITDKSDPLIQSWQKIFPKMFKSFAEMPPTIKNHIRYPIDLFSTQSERLLTYHMSDPQVFYNKEDQWQIPEEIYGNEILSINPYYLIMKLPIAKKEEFVLLHPYTPISRPNLTAWLAARCDGEEYGKLLLYQFPKQKLIYGPDQIQALINQDPIISGQISLWNRQGSKAVQGNLLVIPIEQSLLYVEPLYLEAEQNGLPTLVRVIVVYENRIIMAETLKKALDAIFKNPTPQENSTIIRQVNN